LALCFLQGYEVCKVKNASVNSALDSSDWSEYWSGGDLTSCAGSFSLNYTGPILERWHNLFSKMQPSQTVIDLCTGNGAVPHLLNQYFSDADDMPFVLGVDQADVNPIWLQKLDQKKRAKISILACTDINNLDAVGNQKFDYVISQFGIEYIDPSIFSPVLVKISKVSTHIAFIIHHHDSVITRVSKEEIAHIKVLLAELGVIATTRRWIISNTHHDADSADTLLHDVNHHKNFIDSRDEIKRVIATANVPDVLVQTMSQLDKVIRAAPSLGITRAAAYLDELQMALEKSLSRLNEQVASAKSEAEISEMFADIVAVGRVLHIKALEHRPHGVIAWDVDIT
jgi:hypothetical protein